MLHREPPVPVPILDDYEGVAISAGAWTRLSGRVEPVAFRSPIASEGELAVRFRGLTIIVAMRDRTAFTKSLLERLPKLRLLVSTGPSNAAIDVEAATAQGIAVAGTRSSPGPTVELTWGIIIGIARRLAQEDRAVRRGHSQHTVGKDRARRTLSVLGLGTLGSRVPVLRTAFGMKVIAWSHLLTEERAATLGPVLSSKAQLFALSDVVTIHLRRSEDYRGVVGRREVGPMPSHAVLVNTSRGGLVDEPALVDALRTGTIAGAALDVFDQEPLPPNYPLSDLENVRLVPHLGFVTEGSYRQYYADVLEAIQRWLIGSEVRQLTDRAERKP